MNLTWDDLASAFASQRDFCADYSPLCAAQFTYLARVAAAHAAHQPLEFDEQAVIDLLDREWADRTLINHTEAALLVSTAIHAAVLADDPAAAPISRFFETVGGSFEAEYDREVLWQMLGGLFLHPGETLPAFLRTGRLQTNEISRGAAWLLPALAINAWTPGLPITLIDLGCSAGLNLAADAHPWRWQERDGDRWLNRGADGDGDPLVTQALDFGRAELPIRAALPPGDLPRLNILKRVGLDLNPLHPDNPAKRAMLRACIWGDQAARLTRFDRAVAGYVHAQPAPELYAADMIDAARTLHERIAPGTRLLLVYNTVATLYLTDPSYAALRANLAASFAQLPDGVRGLWLELESPRSGEPATPPKLFALKAHTLADGVLDMRYLAYTEPHPQTIMLLPGWKHIRPSDF